MPTRTVLAAPASRSGPDMLGTKRRSRGCRRAALQAPPTIFPSSVPTHICEVLASILSPVLAKMTPFRCLRHAIRLAFSRRTPGRLLRTNTRATALPRSARPRVNGSPSIRGTKRRTSVSFLSSRMAPSTSRTQDTAATATWTPYKRRRCTTGTGSCASCRKSNSEY